ncbi:AI-2E family transporter [Avibacterium sp. 21-586]|uniref:AI-2E family transporter n=1 Tax=Avibacterium sp. 21-586 TaxID=2911534 RepID=UPI0022471A6B|nr:AI-2E family transporter [Avibacterium sp. 21-586]MCW9710276.1 AI-2E family transporter [Avibacterium sp. 21-586]
MLEMLKNWYKRRFSDPQAMALFAILLSAFTALYFFSDLLAPLLVALVLAYLLEMPIRLLNKKLKFPRLLAIIIVLGGFLGIMLIIALVLIPTLVNQTIKLFGELPHMFNTLNDWLLSLPEHYPEVVDYQMIDSFFTSVKSKILGVGESALKFSISSIISLVSLGIYAFLVPLMLFFLLKDKQELLIYISRYLPRNRKLAYKVWQEMQKQIANYIRGKIIEIIVVGVISYAIFLFFDLRYALLLAVSVGLSVLVPYVGAVLVSIPVALVAMSQFGITPTFWSLIAAYVVSQILDGNLLVPFLFSEAVNLNPLTIIVAVLIFGGLWGFWGVFFAIPLATLVKAVVHSWPSDESIE